MRAGLIEFFAKRVALTGVWAYTKIRKIRRKTASLARQTGNLF